MSIEQVVTILSSLGLNKLDSSIYIYLVKNGPMKGKEISKRLKIKKQQLYLSLKRLQNKGLINKTLEHPAKFSAITIEEVFEIFTITKLAEAQKIQEDKKEILAKSQMTLPVEPINIKPKFNVIEGRGTIYAKILQLMREAKNNLSIMIAVSGLIRTNEFGLYEKGLSNQLNPHVTFRAITQVSKENLKIAKNLLKDLTNEKIKFEVRVPELNSRLPQLIIRDEEELLFFINPTAEAYCLSKDEIGLWTNCKALVQSFIAVFDENWRNSTDIKIKLAEIEKGVSVPKTQIISDSDAAQKKYILAMQSAENEVLMVVSPKELLEISENKSIVNQWAEKSVSAKIMAPITSENIKAIETVSKLIEVRHVPLGYLGTTIIDRRHLFQFTKAPISNENDSTPTFEHIFYTDDAEYIERTKIMLNDIWKNVQKPSENKLEFINRSNIDLNEPSIDNIQVRTNRKMYQVSVSASEQKPKQPTSQDLFNNLKNKKKPTITIAASKDIPITYSTNAQAIIHPPANLQLPETLFHIYHIEKHSTFGPAETIAVHLWLETPKGPAFVTTAIITNNSENAKLWQKCCVGSPAENNIHLVKDDEIDVRVYGNTFFAGWTKPIPLPKPFILPPSCLIMDGYGEVKHTAYDILIPSGFTLKCSGNLSEAYVTYLHPSTKYSGPGTDGALSKDVVIEWHPPKKV